MSKNAGVRAAADTGASTGVATTVLALLSASALASFGLVTANQLAPSPSERVRAGSETALLHPPADVVITPSTGTGGGTAGSGDTDGSPARNGAGVAQPVLAFPILLTLPALQAAFPLGSSAGSDGSTIVPAVSLPELGSGSTPVIVVPAAIPVAPQTSVVVPAVAIPVAPQTSVVVPAAAIPVAPPASMVVQLSAVPAFDQPVGDNPASSASDGSGHGGHVGRDDHHGTREERKRDADRRREGNDDGRNDSNDARRFGTSAPQAASRPVVVDVVAPESDSKTRNHRVRDERQRTKRTSDPVNNSDAAKSSQRCRDARTSGQPGRVPSSAGSQTNSARSQTNSARSQTNSGRSRTSSAQDNVSGRDKTGGDRSDHRDRGADTSRDSRADRGRHNRGNDSRARDDQVRPGRPAVSRVVDLAGSQSRVVEVPGDLGRGRESRDSDNRGRESRDSDNRGGESRDGESRDGESRDSDNRGGESRDGESRDSESRGGDNRGGDSRSHGNRRG